MALSLTNSQASKVFATLRGLVSTKLLRGTLSSPAPLLVEAAAPLKHALPQPHPPTSSPFYFFMNEKRSRRSYANQAAPIGCRRSLPPDDLNGARRSGARAGVRRSCSQSGGADSRAAAPHWPRRRVNKRRGTGRGTAAASGSVAAGRCGAVAVCPGAERPLPRTRPTLPPRRLRSATTRPGTRGLAAKRSAARGGGGVYEWRGPRGMNGGGRARARAGEAGGGVYEWGVRVGVGMGPDAARPCNAEHRQGRREAKRRGSAGLPPPIPTARDVTAVSIEIR